MDEDKSITLGIIIVILISVALFFPVFILMGVYFESSFVNSCFISLIMASLIVYIFIWSRGSKHKDKREKKEVEDDKTEVNIDEIDKEKVEVSKGSKKKKTSILDKLKGKKTCDNCGAELEYKEEFDSYYCPECHEYK